MTEHQWILGRDTGVSSKTILAVMMGVITQPTQCGFDYDVPHDPADFGRCYRLLKLFPAWRVRLEEVANLFPKWRPMVREWSELERTYERELPTGKCRELYDRMRLLVDEGMLCDGWVRESPYSWRRAPAVDAQQS